SLRAFTEEDVFLCWNPLTHASGFALAMFCMLLGPKTVITEPLIPCKTFLETLKRHEVSVSPWSASLRPRSRSPVDETRDPRAPYFPPFYEGGEAAARATTNGEQDHGRKYALR
ncbi:4-coumarate--CoA ligase 1-like, partial [Ixodes scapularis]